MGDDVLTTWGVVVEVESDDWVDAARIFAAAREAYLARCHRLAAFLADAGEALRVVGERVDEIAPGVATAGPLLAGASVIEVRPSSFDMAVRIRATGDDAGRPANGRCTLSIVRTATGETLPVPREVRDELVAIQLAARELC